MNVDIKEAARRKGVKIGELADRLGITRQSLHYTIKQAEKNSVETLQKIANVLDCSFLDLFQEAEGEKPLKILIRCPRCGCVLEFQECREAERERA